LVVVDDPVNPVIVVVNPARMSRSAWSDTVIVLSWFATGSLCPIVAVIKGAGDDDDKLEDDDDEGLVDNDDGELEDEELWEPLEADEDDDELEALL
jgi:hypothetical protein